MTRLLLMGTPQFAVPAFEALCHDKRFDVLGMVCQPDKPVGRKRILTAPPVKQLANGLDIPCLQPTRPNNEDFLLQLNTMNIDMIVVIAYGHILRTDLLNIPRYACVNVHGSLLPLLRGASPIHYAILEGLSETGITYMRMEEGLDSGPILKQFGNVLVSEKMFPDLYDELSQLTAHTIGDTLQLYIDGELKEIRQDDSQASFCSMIKKSQGYIDAYTSTATKIMRKWRAFIEWPNVYVMWQGKRLQCKKMQSTLICSTMPGSLSIEKDKLYIESIDYKIVIESIQMEGKKVSSGNEFINAYKDQIYSHPQLDKLIAS